MLTVPIGIFDSGFGGLTVLKDIRRMLPQFDYLYLGDNARAPYGDRSFDVIYEYTLQSVDFLFSQGCQLVLLACNTASARALRTIQQNNLSKYPNHYRVLGIVRPTVERIDTITKSKHIGILATEGTVISNSYPIEIEKLFPQIAVYQESCPLWVPLVEQHIIDDYHAGPIIQQNISALLNQHDAIDAIILACTHYPILMDTILKHLPANISLVTQGKIVAASLQSYFLKHLHWQQILTQEGKCTFLTTDNAKIFNEKASYFYGEEVIAKQIHLTTY